MALFAVDRRYLEGLSPEKLAAKCARLSDAWVERGRPTEDVMPLWMIGAKAALEHELNRRGTQQTLF